MIGASTTHAVSVDTGTTYIQTAKIKELSPPEESRSTSEDAYLDNADIYKEFVAGMIDAGELSLTLKWDSSDVGQVALDAAFEGTGSIMGRITLPVDVEKGHSTPATFSYSGVVTGRGVAIPKEETITRNYKIKLSGKPDWVQGAA
jgi:hypothetical protein